MFVEQIRIVSELQCVYIRLIIFVPTYLLDWEKIRLIMPNKFIMSYLDCLIKPKVPCLYTCMIKDTDNNVQIQQQFNRTSGNKPEAASNMFRFMCPVKDELFLLE